jgi:hypothetical protein
LDCRKKGQKKGHFYKKSGDFGSPRENFAAAAGRKSNG